MGRIWKLVFVLLVLCVLGLVGFAYFGDLSPEAVDVTEPVVLDAD